MIVATEVIVATVATEVIVATVETGVIGATVASSAKLWVRAGPLPWESFLESGTPGMSSSGMILPGWMMPVVPDSFLHYVQGW